MELAEVTRRKDACEQRAQAERKDVACGSRIKGADACDEQISNHSVEESPTNVDC
jgi:hypothetical protein